MTTKERLHQLIEELPDAELAPLERLLEDAELRALLTTPEEAGSLLETAHLLRSPENARRLLTALEEARRGDVLVAPLEDLLREKGLDRGNSGAEPPERPVWEYGFTRGFLDDLTFWTETDVRVARQLTHLTAL